MCWHTNLKFSIIENMLTQKLKFCRQFYEKRKKKTFQTKYCVKHGHVIRFQSVYCTIDVLLSSLPHYWVLLHMNIPTINTGMLIIIKAYDNDWFIIY